MSLQEAMKLIAESKVFLDAYRMYGQMVAEAIMQLEKIEKLITERSIQEAYKLSNALCEQISNYRSFVPDLADKLDKLQEILKCNC